MPNGLDMAGASLLAGRRGLAGGLVGGEMLITSSSRDSETGSTSASRSRLDLERQDGSGRLASSKFGARERGRESARLDVCGGRS